MKANPAGAMDSTPRTRDPSDETALSHPATVLPETCPGWRQVYNDDGSQQPLHRARQACVKAHSPAVGDRRGSIPGLASPCRPRPSTWRPTLFFRQSLPQRTVWRRSIPARDDVPAGTCRCDRSVRKAGFRAGDQHVLRHSGVDVRTGYRSASRSAHPRRQQRIQRCPRHSGGERAGRTLSRTSDETGSSVDRAAPRRAAPFHLGIR